MSPALEAAFRLATTLPSRVHHKQDPKPKPWTRPGPLPAATIARMRELEALNIPRRRMAAELRMSTDTIRKEIGSRKYRKRRGGWK